MPWGKGPDEFMRFLVEKGLVNPPALNQAPPYVPPPLPMSTIPYATIPNPSPMPQYENSSQYRVRGVEGQQNRALVDPYIPPLPPQYPGPVRSGYNDPTARYRREQAGGIPAPIVNGVPYPNWDTLSPDQQAIILQSVTESTVDPAGDFLGIDKVAEPVADVLTTGVQAIPSIPVMAPGMQQPITIGEIAKDTYEFTEPVVDPIIRAAGYPQEQTDLAYADAAYYMATHDGDKPGWLRATNYVQGALDSAPGGLAFGAIADFPGDKLLITNYLEDNPEKRADVQRVYEEAEAQGTDGTQAVKEWWDAEEGLWQVMLRQSLYDPLNVVGVGAVAADALRLADKVKYAETGIEATRVSQGVQAAISLPDTLVNAPWRLAQPAASVARKVGEVVDRGPIRTLADFFSEPSTQQRYRNITADIAQAETSSVDAALREVPRADTSTPSLINDPDNPYRVIPGTSAVDEFIQRPITGVPPTGTVDASTPNPNTGVPPTGIVPSTGPVVSPGVAASPSVGSTAFTPAPGVPPLTAQSSIDDIFDDVIPVGQPLPPRAQTAIDRYDANGAGVFHDVAKFEQTVPEQIVPLNSRIVVAQKELYPTELQAYIDDPIRVSQYMDAPVEKNIIAIKDGDTYYLVEGTHRTGAARIRGDESIPMRVIDVTPEVTAPGVPPTGIVPSTGPVVQPGVFTEGGLDAAVPVRDPLVESQIISDTAQGKTDELIPEREKLAGLAEQPTSPVATEATASDAVANWPLTPNPTGKRVIDVIARDQPNVWSQASVEPHLTKFVDESFTPGNRVLRTDKMDAADEALKMELFPYAEPFQPKKVSKAYKKYQGTNKAVSQISNAEYLARLKVAIVKNGGDASNINWTIPRDLLKPVGDVKLPETIGVAFEDTFKHWTKESAMARYLFKKGDESAAFRAALIDDGILRTTPGVNDVEQRAYARYTEAEHWKSIIDASPEQMDAQLAKLGMDKTPAPPDPVKPPPIAPRPITPVEAQQITDEQALFSRVIGRDITTDGDVIIAKQLHNGQMGEEEARIASAHYDPEEPDKTVMDLTLEKMGEFDDLATAGRATASDIAIARRKVRGSVVAEVIDVQDLTQPKINKLLRANAAYVNAVKEGLISNPFRAGSAGLQDAIGNSLFQVMRGHPSAAMQTLNPFNHIAWMKHTMKGKELETAPFKLMRELEMRMPNKIVEIQTRDLLDPLDETTWGKLGGYIGGHIAGKTGAKVGAAATRPIASKTARAFRHAVDQNARSVLYADDIAQNLRETRADFLIEMRQTIDGDKVSLIAKDLRGAFGPSQVRSTFTKYDVAGGNQWAQKWRAKLDSLSKAAEKEVEKVHFTYHMSKADEIARHTILFHYWLSRAMLYYPRTVLGNPYLLNLNYKIWTELDKEAERQGVGNPMNLFFKVMAGDGGVRALIDPIGLLTPYVMFRDLTLDRGDETAFDKWNRKFGLFLNPMIAAAAVVAGQSERYPDLSGTLGSRTSIMNLIDEVRNHVTDLGFGPGFTGDPVTHIQNGVIDLVNDAASWVTRGKIGDVPAPDPEQAKVTQAINVMIAQAEKEFGMSYKDMQKPENAAILDEVTAAQVAIMTGQYGDNPRAIAAVDQVTQDRAISTVVRATVPGQVQIQNESVQNYKDNLSMGFETGFDTPAQQDALAQNEAVNAGSPEALTLNTENTQLKGIGTERQNDLYKGWNIIVYDQIDGSQEALIGGKVYSGYEINRMTHEQRVKLADAWVLDNMGTKELESYREDRDEVIAASPDLTEYKAYSKAASKYEGGSKYTYDSSAAEGTWVSGGVRAMRRDLESWSPQFGQQVDAERKRLEAQGRTGEELEESLDIWASGTEGYNAWRGIKDDIRDQPVTDLTDPTKIPIDIGIDDGSASSDTTTSKAETGGYGGNWDAENNRPLYQTELVNEWKVYETAIATFEKEHGPIEDYSYADEFVGRSLPDPTSTLSRYLKWRFEQMEAGKPGDIDSYLKKLDADYKAKHPEKDAA